MSGNKASRIFSNIIAFTSLLSFVVISLALVWSKGICCGDDAYLSTVAKNLANGLGYVSTMQAFVPKYVIRSFDFTDGTGPTIVLPAALFIKTFGNTYWAPGLTNVTLWSLMLVIIGLLLQKYNLGVGFALFAISFLYLDYARLTYHFEHWYALLGEVPTSLLILLGLLVFLRRESRFNQILSGVLFSLAVEAKFLSVVAFLAFLAVQAFIFRRGQSESKSFYIKNYLYRILFVGAGFLLPIMLFESWKFLVLGPSGYLENMRGFLQFVGETGTSINSPSSVSQLYTARIDSLADRFGIWLPSVGFMLILSWFMLNKDVDLKRLYIILTCIVIVYSFYWFFISNGRARYIIICLVLLNFILTLSLLSSRPKVYIFLYFALLIVFPSNIWIRLGYPLDNINGKYFQPSSQTKALLKTSEEISQIIYANPEKKIATQWWATAADVEYILDSSLNFTTFRDDSLYDENSIWVVVNTRFMDSADKDFNELLANCKNVQGIDIYILANCEPEILK